jgi:hypothetical protein
MLSNVPDTGDGGVGADDGGVGAGGVAGGAALTDCFIFSISLKTAGCLVNPVDYITSSSSLDIILAIFAILLSINLDCAVF